MPSNQKIIKDIFLFTLIALFSAIPPLALKKTTNDEKNNMYYISIALLSFGLLTYLYILVFKNGSVGTYYAISKIISIILVFGCGLILFEENLTTKKIIGILLGLISIIILYE